jgi:hypothetical protein
MGMSGGGGRSRGAASLARRRPARYKVPLERLNGTLSYYFIFSLSNAPQKEEKGVSVEPCTFP